MAILQLYIITSMENKVNIRLTNFVQVNQIKKYKKKQEINIKNYKIEHNNSTILGSNCVPEHFLSSAIASDFDFVLL